MKILTSWLRELLPGIPADDATLAADLTLRGIAVDGIFAAADGGSIFEMDITTNRVDAMNHFGVAREAALIYGLSLPALVPQLPAADVAATLPVTIAEPELCGRFTARVLRGVTIRNSHEDVLTRFAALGLKAINNAVDASNFVLHAMGHPTHAFDLDTIAGGIVVVRLAKAGEKLRTLDGIERTLSSDDLVIADTERAISLAGVMGGWDTMITPQTRNVLVEAAWFDPDRIRRSARRHGIHSDASHRFERGADLAAASLASALVSEIILRDGGRIEGDLADVVTEQAAAVTIHRRPIALRLPEVQRMLGATTEDAALDASLIETILRGLGCGVLVAGPAGFDITLPSWRLDLAREIDLIEEIARVYGYNRFANSLPSFRGAVEPLPVAAKQAVVREILLGAGFDEALSSTFTSLADADLFAAQPGQGVAMGNPLSEEAGLLRPSLLPGMVAMLAHNLNHGADTVRLFESGTVFTGSQERVEEHLSLAIGFTGQSAASRLASPSDAPFYQVKGVVETLLAQFALKSCYFDAPRTDDTYLQSEWLQSGRAARVVADGLTLGWLGQLDSAPTDAAKLRQPIYLCELSLERLFQADLRAPLAREISRYPAVERDFSFVFADAVTWQQVEDAVTRLNIEELTKVAPQEIFRDAQAAAVLAHHYSLLIRCTFQSAERTLTEQDLQASAGAIIDALTAAGGSLRG